jgi:hypothetical protein
VREQLEQLKSIPANQAYFQGIHYNEDNSFTVKFVCYPGWEKLKHYIDCNIIVQAVKIELPAGLSKDPEQLNWLVDSFRE